MKPSGRKRTDAHVTGRMLGGLSSPDFLDTSREWRRIFAEWWGTLLLVVGGAGAHVAAAATGHGDAGNLAAAIVPGLSVMAAIYFMGSVSGAHLNPAVTLAFAIRGNFPWVRVPGYVVAQMMGALAAVIFLRLSLGEVGSLGATVPGPHVSSAQALATETLITAGLVNTILGTAAGARNVGPNAAIAVGGYIALAGLWALPVSGASMNPARSLSPDIIRADFSTSWIYIAGPLLGALLAVGFEWILKGPPTREGSRTAQGEETER
ncbi:MAG TPA: aquaporin [Rhizomicrobium sp.]|jgi:aquaporin Z